MHTYLKSNEFSKNINKQIGKLGVFEKNYSHKISPILSVFILTNFNQLISINRTSIRIYPFSGLQYLSIEPYSMKECGKIRSV